MPKWTVQLTAHTIDTNMLYSILHWMRNRKQFKTNWLVLLTSTLVNGTRRTGSLSRRTVFVARRGAGDWIKEAAADVTISWSIVERQSPTCPCSGVPLLWLRYAYTTRCTGLPIKINGPGSRLHLPYVGSFFSQTMFVKDHVFTTTEGNLWWKME